MKINFQFAIIILLGLILAAMVIPGGVAYWNDWKAHEGYRKMVARAEALTPFQKKLIQEGYLHDPVAKRWYQINECIAHHCLTTSIDEGPIGDATFDCREPLTDGIPDQE